MNMIYSAQIMEYLPLTFRIVDAGVCADLYQNLSSINHRSYGKVTNLILTFCNFPCYRQCTKFFATPAYTVLYSEKTLCTWREHRTNDKKEILRHFGASVISKSFHLIPRKAAYSTVALSNNDYSYLPTVYPTHLRHQQCPVQVVIIHVCVCVCVCVCDAYIMVHRTFTACVMYAHVVLHLTRQSFT